MEQGVFGHFNGDLLAKWERALNTMGWIFT